MESNGRDASVLLAQRCQERSNLRLWNRGDFLVGRLELLVLQRMMILKVDSSRHSYITVVGQTKATSVGKYLAELFQVRPRGQFHVFPSSNSKSFCFMSQWNSRSPRVEFFHVKFIQKEQRMTAVTNFRLIGLETDDRYLVKWDGTAASLQGEHYCSRAWSMNVVWCN